MKKALVFVSVFMLVLVAGVALALVTTTGDDSAVEETSLLDEPTTTTEQEREKPPLEVAAEQKQADGPEQEPEPAHHEKEPGPTHTKEGGEESPASDDTEPPDLVILHPKEGQHFSERKVAFEGKTEASSDVRVYAGAYEAEVDELGNWRIVLILEEGGNLAKITAVDASGNETVGQVKVYYDAPKAEAEHKEPKEPLPKEHEFTAHQKYGSCGEDIPYDEWYGFGTPGTKVHIASDFGSSSTTIGEHGKWHLRVDFPESPCNQTFGVVLETDAGHRKVFEFTRICDGSFEHDA